MLALLFFSWPMNPGLKKIIINYALQFWVIFYRLGTGSFAHVGIFHPLIPLIIFLDHVTFLPVNRIPGNGNFRYMHPSPQRILAIDIGSGTQDVLLYEEGKPMENCVQLILPSPTQLVSARIQKATAAGKDIYLFGNTMGGGPCSWAMEKHLGAGLKVFATESAALTFHDNLEEVREKGVLVVGRRPKGTLPIRLGDVQLDLLSKSLAPFDIPLPQTLAIAVQDHGFNPAGSNRRLRFQYWEKFLASGGRLRDLIYRTPPPYMTRMLAVQKDAPGAAIMDTCAAAVWGILCDRHGGKMRKEGFIALNLGNQHTFGAFVRADRILGIFEHHTGRMNRKKIQDLIARFELKHLSNEEVFADGGHGCVYAPAFPTRKKGWPVAVTGPRRSLVDGLDYYAAAPFGDMMLTGCFGLVAALKAKSRH